MRKKVVISISTFLLALFVLSSFQQQQDHKVLFEKAKYTMESKGDLPEAIRLFEKIVKDFPNEREIAAQAQLNIGLCYEKLGKQQAAEAYNKVISQYSDQPQTAEIAKKRLQSLKQQANIENANNTAISNQVVAQTIYTPDGFLGNISPNGKYLSYVDWEHGDMAVYNIETGEIKQITDEGTWVPPIKFGDASVWSPDGKFLAYYWISGKNHQLRIQDMETGDDRILAQSDKDKCPWPIEWTKDGKYLLAVGSGESENSGNLQLISVKDSSVKIIYNLGDQCACGGASISPDGKYVVASLGKEFNPRDIYIFSVDGTYEDKLISYPDADWAPIWTPDGKKVVFASTRSGDPALWTVKVTDGKKVAEPEIVYNGISDNFISMRFTNDGKFVFVSTSMYSDIFMTKIKPDEGTFEAPTSLTDNKPGVYTTPFWSPDGSKIAYISRESEMNNYNDIVVVHDLKTGNEKELKLGLRYIELPMALAWPQWSADGKSLLLKYGLFDETSGDRNVVMVDIESENKINKLKGKSWMVFGPENTIVYINSSQNKIIQKNLDTNKEKTVYETDKWIYHLSISEDKATLAFFAGEIGDFDIQQELFSMKLNDFEPKLLWKTNEDQLFSWYGGLNFFPDGKNLLLSLATRDMDNSTIKSQQFYTFNINTLEKKPLGENLTDPNSFIGHIRLSPDGEKVAFSNGKLTQSIWLLEYEF